MLQKYLSEVTFGDVSGSKFLECGLVWTTNDDGQVKKLTVDLPPPPPPRPVSGWTNFQLQFETLPPPPQKNKNNKNAD